ncbi:MAG: UDP-N-acetylglucosamine 2-epimerase (non-hydrolyzing) [Ignavibacteriaceae bacterium]
MKKILVIFGTRPEAIKLAPLIKELKKEKKFRTVVCYTGQHKDMVKNILKLFDIKVDYDLKIMKKNQDLFDVTAGSVLKLKGVLDIVKPDLLIVQGDTTTAFTASLSAFYKKIKVAHIEAGLRSYNNFHPFPEEVNRRFISILAGFHFAPTGSAADNLIKEGISKANVFITGNTVVDAVTEIKKKFSETGTKKEIEKFIKQFLPGDFFEKKYILITLHRREKFGPELEKTLRLLKDIAVNSEYNFVYPVHLNPNIQAPAKKILKNIKNVYLLPPLDYLPFTYLMNKCHFIITDSGGIQEEGYIFKKPVIVMREVTERQEAVKAGYAFLAGNDEKKVKNIYSYIDKKINTGYNFFRSKNPFGDGKASKKIVNIIFKKLV